MFLRLLLVGFLGLASLTVGANEDAEAYQAKLEELKELIDQLKTELKKVNQAKDELSSELATSETEISDLTRKIERLQGELKQEKKQLALLREQRDQLQQQKRLQSREVEQQLLSAYKLGNQSQLKVLLNQEDSEQIARMLQYHRYIVEARQEKIAAYLATVDELNQVEPAIIAKSERLQTQQDELQKRHADLANANQQRKQTLAKLASRERSTEEDLAELIAQQRELEQLLEEVTQILAHIPIPDDQQPFAKQRGRLHWPVKGRIKHRYGSARAGGKLTWDGVFITAAEGSSVTSVHGGRVVYSDWVRGLGLLMIIDHGDGYLSLYGHNQTLYKDVGEWVGTNEVIALAGNSGGQSQSGLYFEIRQNSEPQNPSQWCRD